MWKAMSLVILATLAYITPSSAADYRGCTQPGVVCVPYFPPAPAPVRVPVPVAAPPRDIIVNVPAQPVTPAVNQTEQTVTITGPDCSTSLNMGTITCNQIIVNGSERQPFGWFNWWSTSNSYYTPPFTLPEVLAQCPWVDADKAAVALMNYSNERGFTWFELWRIRVNWVYQRDYVEACRLLMSRTS